MFSRRRTSIAVAVAFMLGIATSAAVAAVAQRKPQPPPASPDVEAVSGPVITADEAEFCRRVASRADEYRAARGNDVRRSGIRHARDAELFSLGREVNDWRGVITTLSTNGDGKAYVGIKLDCLSADVTLHTWTMALVDAADETLIPPSSPVFVALSSLQEGTRVRFSGSFVAGDEPGAVRETSLTERGGMRAPELVFRFSDLASVP